MYLPIFSVLSLLPYHPTGGWMAVWPGEAAPSITGVGAEISAFENISVIVFLLGAVLFTTGRETATALLFAVLFPAFMLPMPAEMHTSLTNPPEPLRAACSAHILQVVGIPALREGNLVNPPDCPMEAAPACSGVRSLITVIALALLMGYVFPRMRRDSSSCFLPSRRRSSGTSSE